MSVFVIRRLLSYSIQRFDKRPFLGFQCGQQNGPWAHAKRLVIFSDARVGSLPPGGFAISNVLRAHKGSCLVARRWVIHPVSFLPPAAGDEPFLAVGAVSVGTDASDPSAQESAPRGSGFLVNRSVLVTAAHVVLHAGSGEPYESISVDVGSGRLWAWRVAVDARYRSGPGYRADTDLAVLALVGEACSEQDVIAASPIADGTKLSCVIRSGRDAFGPPVRVSSVRRGGWLEYASQNLRGYSGAPVLSGQDPHRAVGVHVWYTGSFEGRAIVLNDATVSSAIDAINSYSNA